jgi:hypothetical protein
VTLPETIKAGTFIELSLPLLHGFCFGFVAYPHGSRHGRMIYRKADLLCDPDITPKVRSSSIQH